RGRASAGAPASRVAAPAAPSPSRPRRPRASESEIVIGTESHAAAPSGRPDCGRSARIVNQPPTTHHPTVKTGSPAPRRSRPSYLATGEVAGTVRATPPRVGRFFAGGRFKAVTQAPIALDTVARAAADPDREQPWADLARKDDEYARIREILGRRPTSSELAMYSVMWSEHCSYKSSKVHLKQFGESMTDQMREPLMVGMGENAGVVDVGQGYAVTFKIESHNHPSYVEPYQGAATGIGGIVRDILAMGARPVAVMDPLRFGPLDAEDTQRVLPGIVAGVGGYGNCLGLPNIGGEAVFDETYLGNPLVNALCVGVMRHDELHLANASGLGNQVILYGARTGGDGIGGVSVLASETFDADGPAKRPAVQVGDPFMEKLLIECTLELFAEGLVAGI